MDYKEKYNAALERAKEALLTSTAYQMFVIKEIFPELAESEDERIRKGIIRNLEYLADRAEGSVKDELKERIAWLEKQGKQKPADKVEPKFHEGDWIISNNKKSIYQVIEVKRGIYVIRDNVDNHEYYIGIEECEKSGRLWTISDAKDGDVLSFYLEYKGNKMVQIGIIEKYVGKHGGCFNTFKVYVGVDWENNFQIGKYMGCSDIRPATKEQRDLLFSRIKQAGYEWDAEKKELKKMEVASKEGEDERIRKAIHIYLDWLDGRENYQPKGVYTMIDWVIKQDKKISADKVIEWLNHHELSRDDVVTSVIPDDSPTSVPHRVKWLSDEFIKQFRKDFGL